MTASIGRWRSQSARERFLRAYEQALALWPAPPNVRDVDTSYGSTRTYRLDPPDPGRRSRTPAVLLHGAEANATAMYPFAAALAPGRPVLAVDVPGHPGRSEEHRPVHPPEDQAAWLDEVLHALELDRVHLVGHSYGGWIALNQAHRRPDRVASVLALDAGGIEATSARFIAYLYLNGLAGLLPAPLRRRAAAELDNPVLAVDVLRRVLLLGALGYRPARPSPRPLTDAELARITAPVLVVVGARSPLLHPETATRRVHDHVRQGRAVVVARTGHGLGFDDDHTVDRLMTDFLNDVDDAPGAPPDPGASA